MQWTSVITIGNPPTARKGMGYCVFSYSGVEYFALYGGYTYSGTTNDLLM